MKTKTSVRIILSVMVFTLIMSIFTIVNADDKLYLGITELKNLNSPSMGYAIGDPTENGKKIWNIVKYPSATSSSTSNINAFCVKAGVGFSDTKKRQEYDRSYNMDTQKEEIAKQNQLFNNLVNDGYYNSVLSLLDLTYFPGENTQEQKDQLLKNAKIDLDEYGYEITDNDIVAVEQAAVWYFTNSDESIYNQYGKHNWLYYTLTGSSYTSLVDYKSTASGGEGLQRMEQCELLYNYLIDTAKKNASSYKPNSTNPIVINDSNATGQEDGNYYVVGPFEINSTNSNPVSLKLTVDNDGKSVAYTILDASKKQISDINSAIGSQFYIRANGKDLTKLNVNITSTFTATQKTLWASSSNNQAQPIVVLNKETSTDTYHYDFTPESKDQFDLSLRKYITKINGKDVETSRVPRVDTTPLVEETSTTANYYGPKNPLQVKKNDIVTYNIRIYNEAQKEGRAVTITDQLPTGMEFVEIVSGSYTVENYDKTTNEIVFRRTNEDNLKPFENTNSLNYETLTYTAKISENANSGVKTNVAWISEEYNAVDNQVIIDQTYPADKNADRDSTPSVHPNVNKDNMEDYKGNSSNEPVTPAKPDYFYKGEQDDDDFEKVVLMPESTYSIKIIKEDKENAKVLAGAEFEINGEKAYTDSNGVLHIGEEVVIESLDQVDKYVIKETKAPNGYTGFDGTVIVELHYKQIEDSYVIDENATVVTILDKDGNVIENSDMVSYELDQTNFILHIKNVSQKGKYSIRIIKEDKANAEALAGAEFEVNGKKAVTDANGVLQIGDNLDITSVDQVDTYVIRETKAPNGYTGFDGTIEVELHYKLENEDFVIDDNKTTVTILDEDGNKIGESELVYYELDKNDFVLHIKNCPVTGKYSIKIIKQDKENAKALADAEFEVNGKKAVTDANGVLQVGENIVISSIDQVDKYVIKETKAPSGYTGFDGTIEVELHYMLENDTLYIDEQKTVVTILDKDGNKIAESDLISYELDKNNFVLHIKNVPQPFDLALIKNIYAVNGIKVPDRLISVDVSGLNLNGATEQPANTAIYKQNKDPYLVQTGDIVTYRIRVYNEGYQNGYASQITEDIPKGLEFLWSEKEGEALDQDITFTSAEKEAIKFNQEMLWTFNSQNNTVSTDILSKENELTPGSNLIQAFGYNDGSKTAEDLHYKEVFIMLRVIATDPGDIRNEACITKDQNESGSEVQDRDSDPDKWVKYEDDEDYDIVKLENFDLALRKWIMGVSADDNFDETDYIKNKNGEFTRAPVVDTSKLNTIGEDGKLITTAIYNGPKTPVSVTINDYVMYCIRVYNEGGVDGYASEIQDHLPPYLEFVDNSFNKQYGWSVSSNGRVVTSRYLNEKLIPAAQYDSQDKITLSYVDLPIICRVKNTTQAGYINTNIAEIMKYENKDHNVVTDRDSKPGDTVIPDDSQLPTYKENETGSYIPGQFDDDDFEKVVCNIFDLALKKWVSDVITIQNGQTTVTPTGFSPYDNPEQMAKVEIHRNSVDSIKVKFKFGIRVINEGNVAGYATEVKDIIPDGLIFNKSENPEWNQTSDNVVVTKALAETLLEPGQYADVYIILEWKNSQNNLGIKTNWAEISEDYNKENIPDIDSIPNNGITTEDDMDDAKVLLSISTGQNKSTTNLIVLTSCLGILVVGLYTIKRVVLDT